MKSLALEVARVRRSSALAASEEFASDPLAGE
jgi:hypothetical protein